MTTTIPLNYRVPKELDRLINKAAKKQNMKKAEFLRKLAREGVLKYG